MTREAIKWWPYQIQGFSQNQTSESTVRWKPSVPIDLGRRQVNMEWDIAQKGKEELISNPRNDLVLLVIAGLATLYSNLERNAAMFRRYFESGGWPASMHQCSGIYFPFSDLKYTFKLEHKRLHILETYIKIFLISSKFLWSQTWNPQVFQFKMYLKHFFPLHVKTSVHLTIENI